MILRFTLSHSVLGDLEIDEPDGFATAKLKLERHEEFHSLVEHYEGSADGAFIFYGDAVDFLKQAEQIYGPDTEMTLIAEKAMDNINYDTVFTGLIDYSTVNEMGDHKMQLAVIQTDLWTKFISRKDTPIDLQSALSLSGDLVSVIDPVDINLTPQALREQYSGDMLNSTTLSETLELHDDKYLQIDMDEDILDELDTKFLLGTDLNPELPTNIFTSVLGGSYNFDLRIEISILYWTRVNSPPTCQMVRHVDSCVGYLDLYLQINNEAPILFTETESPLIFTNHSSIYTLNDTYDLKPGDTIRIYADILANIAPLGDSAYYWFHSKTGKGTVNIPLASFDGISCVFDASPDDEEIIIDAPSLEAIPSYYRVYGDTIYPENQAQGFLLHDAAGIILDRLTDQEQCFQSEYLGSGLTNYKQYDEDGCAWRSVLMKGMQLRNYTLTQKPFFLSFMEWWNGANPMFNLGLGYIDIEGSPERRLIEIEKKEDFYDPTISVYISNVPNKNIRRLYDNDRIFKKVTIGHKEGKSEDISGIDDPQKHIYADVLKHIGKEIVLESDFIAAPYAWETTRRKTIKQSADYKFDDKTFILAINGDDVSPDVYVPELDENFSSITGLLNSATRYNSRFTPARALLRWLNFLQGCLQTSMPTAFKFQSGEGNYDMVSTMNSENCPGDYGGEELSEKQDIPVTTDFIHFPGEYEIIIDLSWEDYQIIRANRKKAIGISFTSADHAPFFIKILEYEILKGQATIRAWPKEYFDISIPESLAITRFCPATEVCDRITEDGDTRITEDGFTRILEEC